MDEPDLTPLDGAVVAAVDDSPPARAALRFAADLLEGRGRSLHVLSVWNFVNGVAPEQGPDEPPSVATWQAEAERRLEELITEELGDRAGLDVRRHVVHGNTVPVLMAASRLAEHLVLGSRGRGGFTGMLLGSTSLQLVNYAGCPVTVVRQGTDGA